MTDGTALKSRVCLGRPGFLFVENLSHGPYIAVWVYFIVSVPLTDKIYLTGQLYLAGFFLQLPAQYFPHIGAGQRFAKFHVFGHLITT